MNTGVPETAAAIRAERPADGGARVSAGAQRMRVVHCMPIFSELTQTFIYELVGAMAADDGGIDTRVLTWQRRNERERPFDPVDTVPPPTGGEILRIRLARAAPGILERVLFPPTRFERRVAQRLREAQPDLLHAHFGQTAVLIGRACRMARIPLMVTFRGRDASAKIRKAHWRRLYRRTLSRAAAVTFVSEDLRRRIAPLLPAGTDVRVIVAGKRPRQLEYRPPPEPAGRLISVGRLIEKKGHADAIRAVARARERGTRVTLTVVGEGPLRPALEAEIAHHGLGDRVTLTGALPFDEVVIHLQGSDILIAANRTGTNGDAEGIPNVVKEAQLAGLPLAATRHGGIPQAVPAERRGELVEEGDIDALATRVIELCNADRATLAGIAERGREHVLATFDPAAEVDAYRTAYASVLSRPSPDRAGAGGGRR